MLNKELSVYWAKWLEYIKPDPIMTVSEWSDRFRVLSSKSSSEHGRWKTERTPYLKEIMDCLSPSSPYEEITFMKGSQVGGTECGLNWLGFIIDMVPGPTLYVSKTVDTAMRVSKQRLDPMIEDNERLKEKVASRADKTETNTTLMKGFRGGMLILTGANSAIGLRSMPIKNLFLDEISSFEGDVGGEGDAVVLAKRRTNTYGRKKKIFKVSSPTESGTCRIEQEFLLSDMRKFHVPCPHCSQMQELRFENLKWTDGEPWTVRYYCEGCGEGIEEHHKTEMLSKGKWVASNAKKANEKHAGFHLNALYSPYGWLAWSEIAQEYEESKDNHLKYKAFVNTILGETYQQSGEAPDWAALYQRREHYKTNTIPEGVLFLTAAVDVQANYLVVEVKGWGRKNRNWSIDYRIFEGNTDDPLTWKPLDNMLAEIWHNDAGRQFSIQVMAVDTGFQTQRVYGWCREKGSRRVMPIKGIPGGAKAAPVSTGQPVEVRLATGRSIKRGLMLFKLNVDLLKEEVYSWLKVPAPTSTEIEATGYPYGYAHFPEYDEEYFQQLCAEVRKVQLWRGHKRFVWEKIRRSNEALDLMTYNRAAAIMYGVDRFDESKWKELEAVAGSKPIKEKNFQKKEVKSNIVRKKSDFWG